MIKLGIVGVTGKMGLSILDELQNYSIDIEQKVIGIAHNFRHDMRVDFTTSLDYLFAQSDAVIDFSHPEMLIECLEINKRYRKIFVSGTTPINDDIFKALTCLGQVAKVYWSPNMSIGIEMMLQACSKLASNIPIAEVEIIEAHHGNKIDAPSGTAKYLGAKIAESRGFNIQDVIKTDRNGKRNTSDIGFSSIRGGSIIGEHTVKFFFGDEIIEITHKAQSRRIFAIGAINKVLELYNN